MVPLLWYRYCGTDIVSSILWHRYCGTDIVALILWHRYCIIDIVAPILWHLYCGIDIATPILWHRYCVIDIVTPTLWPHCGVNAHMVYSIYTTRTFDRACTQVDPIYCAHTIEVWHRYVLTIDSIYSNSWLIESAYKQVDLFYSPPPFFTDWSCMYVHRLTQFWNRSGSNL